MKVHVVGLVVATRLLGSEGNDFVSGSPARTAFQPNTSELRQRLSSNDINKIIIPEVVFSIIYQ